MHAFTSQPAEIERMPRGGPNASWLDRRFQTDALEYTDRYDVSDDVKQSVIQSLDLLGAKRGLHENNARAALEVVAGIDAPRILELGAGHGRLSEQLVSLHPKAHVTITDLDPTSVHNVAEGPLGAHPRVTTKVVDATDIDEPDGSYDLVVFAAAFHHLPPGIAYRAIAEATRVGAKFLVVDIRRPPSLMLALSPLFMLPAALAVKPSAFLPLAHDGIISMFRSYSPEAFVALGHAADPAIRTEFRSPITKGTFPREVCVVFTRT